MQSLLSLNFCYNTSINHTIVSVYVYEVRCFMIPIAEKPVNVKCVPVSTLTFEKAPQQWIFSRFFFQGFHIFNAYQREVEKMHFEETRFDNCKMY